MAGGGTEPLLSPGSPGPSSLDVPALQLSPGAPSQRRAAVGDPCCCPPSFLLALKTPSVGWSGGSPHLSQPCPAPLAAWSHIPGLPIIPQPTRYDSEPPGWGGHPVPASTAQTSLATGPSATIAVAATLAPCSLVWGFRGRLRDVLSSTCCLLESQSCSHADILLSLPGQGGKEPTLSTTRSWMRPQGAGQPLTDPSKPTWAIPPPQHSPRP